MKLNKKGFGVAEIAIVILLIGILAAAVIAGFMGIKKNATEHVKEEATKSIEIINQTKHAYPTILSSDLTSGLTIEEGEYEVYELGGYSIKGTGYNGVDALTNKGTLFLSGNGTLDKTSKIDGGTGWSVVNYGELTLSDLVIQGGKGNKIYPIECYGDSKTYLNNVVCEGDRSVIVVDTEAKVFISGANSKVSLTAAHTTNSTGRHIFYILGEVNINDGKYTVGNKSNTYGFVAGGSLTIKKGYFSGSQTYAFYLCNEGKIEIHDGVFNIPNGKFFNLYVANGVRPTGTITITGGTFLSDSAMSVTGYHTAGNDAYKDAQIVEISGGYFQQKPTVGIAEGYRVSDTQRSVVCSDGVTRTLWVVEKIPPETTQE